MSQVTIVKKGTREFKEARDKFIECFNKKNPIETLIKRSIGAGTTLNKDLPMPFGCFDLSIYVWDDGEKITGIGFFCDRLGCICACAREGMKETYPTYCPELHDTSDSLDELYEWEDEEDW